MDENEIKKHNQKWYQKTYSALVDKAKTRGLNKNTLEGYYEKHHILPKCMGGSDSEDNLVLLTYREHVLAHMLLTKIYPNNYKLFHAIYFMMNSNGFKVIKHLNTKYLEQIRTNSIKMLRETNSGKNNPMYGKHISEKHKKILSNVNKRKRSDLTKKRMSEAQKGKTHSKETKEKLSKIHIGMKIHSEEHKKLLSVNWSGSKNPNFGKDLSGENNPRAKKVISPDGKVFDTIKSCAKYYNKGVDTIRRWIKEKPEKGFRLYIDDNKNKEN